MWPPHLVIWCTAEAHKTDNCRPLAGWSTLTRSALQDFNSHYVLGMQTAGPNVLCVCLRAISSLCSDTFWHFKCALITEERQLFSEGCICWKALSLLVLGPSQVLCQEIKSVLYLMNRLPQGIHAEVWAVDTHIPIQFSFICITPFTITFQVLHRGRN